MRTVHTICAYTYSSTIRIWYGNSWVYGDMKAEGAQKYHTGASKGASHLLLLYHEAEVFKMGAWHLPQ